MPDIEVLGYDPNYPETVVIVGPVTLTVIDILIEMGLEEPYPIENFLLANIQAGELAASQARELVVRWDPSD